MRWAPHVRASRGFRAWTGLAIALFLAPAAHATPHRMNGQTAPHGPSSPDGPRMLRLGSRDVPVWVSRFDLGDPKVVLHLTFAQGRDRPSGPEAFARLAARAGGAVAVNGTFFNLKTYETFGNLVTRGRVAQHRDWDQRGTALVIGRDGRARLQAMRRPGAPDPSTSWLVLPAGPRLLDQGQVSLAPRSEGFQDPVLFSSKPRTALGLSENGRMLWVASIRQDVTLHEEAQVMQRLGVSEALNLDGGSSVGLAVGGRTRIHPRTPLTQALVVYDARHPAPTSLSRRYADWLTERPSRSGTPPR